METANFFLTLENSQKFMTIKQLPNQNKGNFKMVGSHQGDINPDFASPQKNN